jgi:hypothetical protein
MEQEIGLNEICIYTGNYNQRETLVRVVSIREDSDGWTHKVQIVDNPKNRYWVRPCRLTPVGKEESDLVNDLDSVGLL